MHQMAALIMGLSLQTRGWGGDLHSSLWWGNLWSNKGRGEDSEEGRISWYRPPSLTSSYRWLWESPGTREASSQARGKAHKNINTCMCRHRYDLWASTHLEEMNQKYKSESNSSWFEFKQGQMHNWLAQAQVMVLILLFCFLWRVFVSYRSCWLLPQSVD